jgi:hypothetical protein
MSVNAEGRLTPKLRSKFQTLDRRRAKALEEGIDVPWPEFMSLVKGQKINAGIQLSVNRPGGVLGACCYYYPNPYGFLESAMYVLPQDLYTMDSLE